MNLNFMKIQRCKYFEPTSFDDEVVATNFCPRANKRGKILFN